MQEDLFTKSKTKIQGYLIFSKRLETDLWLIVDPSFVPDDDLARYYPEEIPLLRGKSQKELLEVQSLKVNFPGARIKQ